MEILTKDIISNISQIGGILALPYLIYRAMSFLFLMPKIKFYDPEIRRNIKFKKSEEKDFFRIRVKNPRLKKKALNCICKVRILKRPQQAEILVEDAYLHWGDEPVSDRIHSPDPIDIYRNSSRIIDVAFKLSNNNLHGCWLATPFALNNISTIPNNQFFLIPGKYIIEIEVVPENGRRTKSKFELISPKKNESIKVNKKKFFGDKYVKIIVHKNQK